MQHHWIHSRRAPTIDWIQIDQCRGKFAPTAPNENAKQTRLAKMAPDTRAAGPEKPIQWNRIQRPWPDTTRPIEKSKRRRSVQAAKRSRDRPALSTRWICAIHDRQHPLLLPWSRSNHSRNKPHPPVDWLHWRIIQTKAVEAKKNESNPKTNRSGTRYGTLEKSTSDVVGGRPTTGGRSVAAPLSRRAAPPTPPRCVQLFSFSCLFSLSISFQETGSWTWIDFQLIAVFALVSNSLTGRRFGCLFHGS